MSKEDYEMMDDYEEEVEECDSYDKNNPACKFCTGNRCEDSAADVLFL